MGGLWSQTLETSFEVSAPLPTAWRVLTAFEDHSKWNRFLVSSKVLPLPSQSSSSTSVEIIPGKSHLYNRIVPPTGPNDPRYADFPAEEGKEIEDEQNDKAAGGMIFRPLVLKYGKSEDNSSAELRWRGSLGEIPGIFDGTHYFQLSKISNTQTKIVHGEHFSGFLVLLLKCLFLLNSVLIKNTRLGFLDFNRRWKTRAEKFYAIEKK